MAQFTRTTQCLKFSCYELCKFETGIYVCWIIFFWSQTTGQPLVLWEITSPAGPLEPNTLGYGYKLGFYWWNWTVQTLQDPEHGCWGQGPDTGTILNRWAPNAQSRIICMDNSLLWFCFLFICIWFYEQTKAADLSTTLTSSPSFSAPPPAPN